MKIKKKEPSMAKKNKGSELLFDPTKVAIEIEKMTASGQINYIEAVCEFCERHNIEVEEVGKYLHKNILEKVKMNAEELKMVTSKSKRKLPF